MIKASQLISDFHQEQKNFGYLQSINLKRVINDIGCTEYSVEIVLCDFPFHCGGDRLVIRFDSAKDIKIGNVEGLFRQMITIYDVSENQWENVRFHVLEVENDQFSFYCKNIEFSIVGI